MEKVEELEDRIRKLESKRYHLSFTTVISLAALLLSCVVFISTERKAAESRESFSKERFKELHRDFVTMQSNMQQRIRKNSDPDIYAEIMLQYASNGNRIADEMSEIVEEIEGALSSEDLFNVGEIYLIIENFERALDYFKGSLAKAQDKNSMAKSTQAIALALYKIGGIQNIEEARRLIEEAINLQDDRQNINGSLNAALYIERFAQNELELGNRSESLKLFREALTRYTEIAEFSQTSRSRISALEVVVNNLEASR